MLRISTAIGGLTAVAACVFALQMLGWGENLTGMIDGRDALDGGRLTAWGSWSIAWRSGLAGFAGFAISAVLYGLLRRTRQT